MINREVDLRNINGEANLASALGLDTAPVGGLWKRLKRKDENFRAQELGILAAALAREISLVNDAPDEGMLKYLAGNYGISPKVVMPLAEYHKARIQYYEPRERPGGWFFNS
ncbi:MAG TPA: hypothetical protein VJI97_04600 [Candidatus Nanoarchaeia archaeon]|nr:hypothetical protein [Candidatus Nanoarchaeia archaeon]